MAVWTRWRPMTAIALFLALSGNGWPGGGESVASASPARLPAATPTPTAPAAASEEASQDPNYYAYATRYYLQYLSSREQAANHAKDPYFFFNYYQFYRERYAPGAVARGSEGPVPAWFASMPFRNARTQAFARFVQVATPSADPAVRLAQPRPPRDLSRTAGK